MGHPTLHGQLLAAQRTDRGPAGEGLAMMKKIWLLVGGATTYQQNWLVIYCSYYWLIFLWLLLLVNDG
jgi:hypothetical protein